MELREYQKMAHSAVLNALLNEKINPLVVSATGTGKSVMIANLINELVSSYKSLRVVCLTHKAELIEQNAKKYEELSGNVSGIVSAKLKLCQFNAQVVFASIQTVAKRVEALGIRHLVIVDEPHLIPDDENSQYRKTIKKLKESFKKLKIVGYTATPYRRESGRIDQGKNKVFDKTVFEYGIDQGINDGYLAPIVTNVQTETMDLSNAQTRGKKGDYKLETVELPAKEALEKSIDQILEAGKNRTSWILFCSTIENCRHASNILNNKGVINSIIDSNTKQVDRSRIITEFKQKKIKAIINLDVLTTGFDAPNIDLIVMLRPTTSPSLYVQMVGRGTRKTEGKADCLLLDYAGNIKRHGPVNKVTGNLKKKRNKEKIGTGDGYKHCPECQHKVAFAVLTCPKCFFVFSEKTLYINADNSDIIEQQKQESVVKMIIKKHFKNNDAVKPENRSVRIIFTTETNKEVSHWLNFNKKQSYPSRAWWKAFVNDQIPESTEEAFDRKLEIKMPKAILIDREDKYYKIRDFFYQ